MSEQPSVVELMSRVMRDVRSVQKADTNTHFNFKFRGIDTILDAVGPALREHGIVVIPEVRDQRSEPIGKGVRVIVTVAYTFHGPAGDHLTAVVPGEAQDQQDKASSKAMSVAFRTALIQALAIPTGEPDPHSRPPVSTKLARLQAQVKELWAKKERPWSELEVDYTEWSQGGEIGAADEKDLAAYVTYLSPKQTIQRQQRGGQS